MLLPGYEFALVPQQKITEYLLSLSHRDGRSKAIFFLRFGFDPELWERFAEALRQHAATYEVVEMEETAFGRLYSVEGALLTPDQRCPLVRVVWFIPYGDIIPHLVTAYPGKGRQDDQ